ncbi:uncharacterized protein LOC110409826 [Herrania umbratica]|uniref:Uncharacterized protein LOC110409826 n=1 Tax=Herrania umbratica TaxID=108875 RepID=A0A6J0ZJH0_9ROSI|nr:uncharacterized protein LOC110409826 [Herrania umbratica]
MASSQTFESCSEHKIPVADETYQPTEHVQRAQWLRAAILGANDGLLSTTSLMLGVGAAEDDRWSMIMSGLAGALAGACSMAVGEFVSVSTQRDIEQATAARCTSKTDTGMQHDHVKNLDMTSSPTTVKASKLRETNLGMLDTPTPTRTAPCRNLACSEPTEKIPPPVLILEPKPQVLSSGRSPIIKVITKDLSTKAVELVQDHMEKALPNPYKAAAASALAFLCGSVVPLASAAFIAENIIRIVVIAVVTSIALALFGCFGAHLGGLPVRVSAARVLVGGWIAMAITYDMDHQEEEFSPPLAVLPRLDRLDRLLQFLEERRWCLSARQSSNYPSLTSMEVQCKTLSSALEEVSLKGTLMERLTELENRVSQLSLELDIGNTLRSSSSTIPIPEQKAPRNKELNGTLKMAPQKKQDPLIKGQESSTTKACERKPPKGGRRKSILITEAVRRKKLLRWFQMGC